MSAQSRTRTGLKLPAHKQLSTGLPIAFAAPPAEAVLPLDQHAGTASLPCVEVGDEVCIGTPIARPDGNFSAWLHAPVSGRVIAIESRPAPHSADLRSPSIVIANDGNERRDPRSSPLEDFSRLDPSMLCDHIARGGIVGLGGAAFPTAAKLATGPAPVEHLILNGAECEPYITCDDLLMRERAVDVLRGAQIMLHAVQAARCTVAVEDDKPLALQSLRQAAASLQDARLAIVSIPTLYPAGDEGLLVATLTGTEIPRGHLPQDVGIVCHNVGTAAAVTRWICAGEPLIGRVITVTGHGVQRPRNLEVRLGTSFAQLIDECGGYADVRALIMGGSMMGKSLPNDAMPVVKASHCIIAAADEDLLSRGPEQPCIRCGDCATVCPVGLLPQQLHWHLRNGNETALADLGLMDCIACGCCDYVCPSHIRLASAFKSAHRNRRLRAGASVPPTES